MIKVLLIKIYSIKIDSKFYRSMFNERGFISQNYVELAEQTICSHHYHQQMLKNHKFCSLFIIDYILSLFFSLFLSFNSTNNSAFEK